MNRYRFLCVAIIGLLFSAPGCGSPNHVPAVKRPVKIMMVGASVTAGFGTILRLAEVIDVAIDDPIEISDTADVMFFRNPPEYAKKTFGACRRVSPDILIGVDLLFWFAYGGGAIETREMQLHSVLTRLGDMKDCSIVVGDIPAFPAGPMLPARMIPTGAELKRLNAVIWKWAEACPNVRVLPLASYMQAMAKSEAVRLCGRRVILKRQELILLDKLHMSTKGLSFLAAAALGELKSGDAPLNGRQVEVDWDRLYARTREYEIAKLRKAMHKNTKQPAVRDVRM